MKDNKFKMRTYGPAAAQTLIEILEFNLPGEVATHTKPVVIDDLPYCDVIIEGDRDRVVGILEEEFADGYWIVK